MQLLRRQREAVFQVKETGHNNPRAYSATDPALPEYPPISHFIDGIKVLSNPPNATCDICFIHGLTGDRERTWTAKGQSAPWPQSLLPQKLQQARILTYGYDAYVISKSKASRNRLIDHATNLLADLTSDRESCNASSRPLIFVVHSLGGLVCKKAILLSRNNPERHFQGVFDALKGVIFMGTPHMGAWMADWAKIPATAFGFVKSINISLLDVLQRNNQFLESIQRDFLAMVRQVRENGRPLEITCFFEELPTPKIGTIVTKDSASFDGYAPRAIRADHQHMVKFATVEDPGFKRVLGELERWTLAVDHYALSVEDGACLRDLYTTDPRDDKKRIEKVKGGLLKDSYRWIFENNDFKKWLYDQQGQLLWIKGDPGKGKTMLLCGIINELKSTPQACVVFFFCQATDARINHASAVLRGLIYMLVAKQPKLMSHMRRQHDKTGKKGFEDANAWETLSKIFIDILEDPLLQSTYVIIDALDECTADRNLLLELIAQKSSVCTRIKWVVSSRNWHDIGEALEPATKKATLWLELNEKSVAKAVTIFIQHKVRELTEQKKYKAEVRDAISQHLFSNARGTFLWVALVCLELAKGARWDARLLLTVFPPGLESLYARMIDQIHKSPSAEICKRLLGVALVTYRPITLGELLALVDIPKDITINEQSLNEVVEACGSFLTVREGVVFFVHQSAKDFLLQTASKKIFARGIEAEHYTILFRSLQSFRTLRRDIYGLKSPGFPITQVRQPDPDPLAAVRYSCLYWVDHLLDGNAIDELREGGLVEGFLKQRYLFWLEAMSLMGYIPEAIAAMLKLNRFLQKLNKAHKLAERIRDASRFIQYHGIAIENSPLQVYFSSLIFSPTRSMIKSSYQSVKTKWLLKDPLMDDEWSPCLQILEGHRAAVTSIAWSKDGNSLASGSSDTTIRIWDPSTGRCTSTLRGHKQVVVSISWSPDGARLASGSLGRNVKIWDLPTRQCISTLEVDSSVTSISWSQNGRQLVIGSTSQPITIWDQVTGEFTWTLAGPTNPVCSIISSLDRSWLASKSDTTAIKIWDIATGRCTSTLTGHSSDVLDIAWSHNGSRLASASVDMTIKIWDPAIRRCILTLEGHSSEVSCIAWSRDAKWIASGSFDGRVMIWNADTGQCISELEGHRDTVSSVSWSRDGSQVASASTDGTLKIWDPALKQGRSNLEGHNELVYSMEWSRDGSQLASGSHNGKVMIWNPATDQCMTLRGYNDAVFCIAWSRDGRQLAIGSDVEMVKIWDVATSKCVKTLAVRSGLSLQYDEVNVHYLHTDRGIFDLRSSALIPTSFGSLAPQPEQGVYAFNKDHTWITMRGENFLWIPSEYRTCCMALFAARATTTVAIGCLTGRVLFLTLPNNNPIL
ncbi:WD40 repeat-like protein [Penicillium vulpinum]|uniref:WD40 repeat-like protein n=1 Tax=Penicillium vulpinum TaxID=29845 RepID=UPI0025495A02|nr:WD40 repeat-like protein [Penicillium vulpinum]KAJ5970512.1 WD40 repeat-like protein [Penicillium vulpinum]